MYSSRVRNVELPENLFTNLGEIKSKKIERKVPTIITDEAPVNNDYQFDTNIKLTNYSNRKEYRDRIDRMYEDIKEITPIDNEVDNVLYFNNYIEKGIVIKPKISSLKQFWTEYRLISNEKTSKKNHLHPQISLQQPAQSQHQLKSEKEQKLDDFDTLFEALSERVIEINKYIDELKEMRKNINITSNKLEEDKEKLSEERKKFLDYKKTEEHRIKEEKENLKINFARLQTIIDDLDKKLVSIDNNDK